MTRTLIIYFAVLTAAEFVIPHAANADSQSSAVVVEDMQPVKADGRSVTPPNIMDFTKDPEADQQIAKIKRETKKLVSKLD